MEEYRGVKVKLHKFLSSAQGRTRWLYAWPLDMLAKEPLVSTEYEIE
jgi:hypothetical protein